MFGGRNAAKSSRTDMRAEGRARIYKIKGRTELVTGASIGIGRAIASQRWRRRSEGGGGAQASIDRAARGRDRGGGRDRAFVIPHRGRIWIRFALRSSAMGPQAALGLIGDPGEIARAPASRCGG